MSALQLIVVVGGLAMIAGLLLLILLWAGTEALPQATRVPLYERLEPGEWGVRLTAVGRRRSRTMRLINGAIGGDIARALWLVRNPPAMIIEGIDEAGARELIEAIRESGGEAELVFGDYAPDR